MGLYQYGFVIKNDPKEEPKKEPLFVDSGDKMHTPKPTRLFLAWCGCGSISSKVKTILQYEKIIDVDKVKVTMSIALRRYIQLTGLDAKCPSLKRGTYAVLIDPINKTFLDLNDRSRTLDDTKKEAYKMAEEYNESIKRADS